MKRDVGAVWELGHSAPAFVIVELGVEDKDGVELLRCLTLVSNHPQIPVGGVELWHPTNLDDARRLA